MAFVQVILVLAELCFEFLVGYLCLIPCVEVLLDEQGEKTEKEEEEEKEKSHQSVAATPPPLDCLT